MCLHNIGRSYRGVVLTHQFQQMSVSTKGLNTVMEDEFKLFFNNYRVFRNPVIEVNCPYTGINFLIYIDSVTVMTNNIFTEATLLIFAD